MSASRGTRAIGVLAAALLAVGALAPTASAAPPKKPPVPVITSAPAAFTNQTTATVSFTSASLTAKTSCSLDGVKATACTSPVTYTGLAAGAHTFSVFAQDGKVKSGTASASWTVDLTAPAAPSVAQPASPTRSMSYSVSFGSSSADVQSYRCSLDGAAATTCTSPATGSGLTDGYHQLTVSAVDRAGNTSSGTTVSWAVDASTPDPVVTSGPPSAANVTSATFTFASTEPGVSYSCARDTNTFTACTSPQTYPGLSYGNHDFRVRATDPAGNVATSATYTWRIQAPALPTLAWNNPAGLPPGVTNQAGATFGFTSSSTALTCTLDEATPTTCTSPTTVTGLADGAHAFTVTADRGLSTEVQLTYRWTVDTVAPGAPTVVGPTGTIASDQADITVTPAAVGDAVTCEVDLEPVTCTGPFTLSGLAEGPHAVVAVAADSAGNQAEAYAYWIVDTTAPTVTISVPASLTSAVVVDFDEDVTGVSVDSVALTDGAGTPLATTMVCRDYLDATTDCSGETITQVRLSPAAPLVPGEQYAAVVNPPAAPAVSDVAGNAAAAATQAFRGAPEVGETSPALGWTWRTVKTSKAKGGSYLTEHLKGASLSWTFSGRSVSWLTAVGPTQGTATVLLDGVKKTTANNYARTTKYGVARTFKGLAKGKHTITVIATGKKGAKSGKGTFVTVDGFKVGTRVTATPTVTTSWQRRASPAARDGSYASAGQKGQSVRLTFRGTGITWVTATGKGFGKAAVYIDGVLTGTYDNYSATTSWQVERTVTGLTDGTHTLLLKVLGTRNAAASGTLVVVDGFSVS